MNNDRELLELAAKAAGYKIRNEIQNHDDDFIGFRIKGDGMENAGNGAWNPLTDDGDALRLAVKLRINIEHVGQRGGALNTTEVHASPRGNGHLADMQPYTDDALAATRRAIVRAAAEIGKAMP